MDDKGRNETSLVVELANVAKELSKPATGALATIWARQALEVAAASKIQQMVRNRCSFTFYFVKMRLSSAFWSNRSQ